MKEANFPEGWGECSVEMLAKFIDYRGRTPKKTPNGIPLITAKNIRDGYINREPREYIAESDYEDWMTRGIPNVGDVVITTEAPMGNVAVIDIDEKFALAQRAICLQCYEPETGSFLHYALRNPIFQKLLTLNATGTTVSGIKAATLRKLNIPFPPLAEQKVIADKLDTLLAQVETTKARLDRIPQILKTFRQSVLAAAMSGKLTEEWRGKNGVSKWQQKTLGDVVAGISQGWSPKCLSEGTSDKSWGVIKTSSVQERLFVEQENKKLPDHLEPREALKVVAGDILTTRAGPRSRCGVSCYVENVTLNLMICDKVYRYQVKPEMGLSKFLVMQLNSHPTLESIESLKTGISESGMNLTQKKFKALPLKWPSKEEQTQIVHRVEELFAFADSIEQKANAALERVNNLTQSILAKAFRGELTADWRAESPELISGENSAEALLAKIKAERDTLSSKKKPKKKAVKKAK